MIEWSKFSRASCHTRLGSGRMLNAGGCVRSGALVDLEVPVALRRTLGNASVALGWGEGLSAEHAEKVREAGWDAKSLPGLETRARVEADYCGVALYGAV
jgi:hypothetical protein